MSPNGTPAAFDPTTISADAIAVFVDTAPAEVRYAYAEATTLMGRVIMVQAFIPGIRLATAVAVARSVDPATL